MARPLRFFVSETTVEVTIRTIQGRLLLRPSEELNPLIVGVLAKAQQRYNIAIHAVFFASNHYHLIVTTPNALVLARFMNFVNSNLAREAGRLHDWQARFWSRRYRAIPILDDVSLLDRVHYLLSHGCKEGLVTRPQDWPGVSSLRAMLRDEPMEGIWIDRTALWHASRKETDADPDAFSERLDLHLAPLPCWSHIPPRLHRRRLRSMLARIIEETRDNNAAVGRNPPGRAFVLAQDPHARPRHSKRSPAPRCHTSIRRLRREFQAAYFAFLDAYHEASQRLRNGDNGATFPEDCFPPPLAYTGIGLDPSPT